MHSQNHWFLWRKLKLILKPHKVSIYTCNRPYSDHYQYIHQKYKKTNWHNQILSHCANDILKPSYLYVYKKLHEWSESNKLIFQHPQHWTIYIIWKALTPQSKKTSRVYRPPSDIIIFLTWTDFFWHCHYKPLEHMLNSILEFIPVPCSMFTSNTDIHTHLNTLL